MKTVTVTERRRMASGEQRRRMKVLILLAALSLCGGSRAWTAMVLPSENPSLRSHAGSMAAEPMSLMLRGGAYEDNLPFSDEGSGSSESNYDENLYNLTEAFLKDPQEQGNLTHLYDLLIRPPIMPPMKDGKMLSGIGLLLSRDPPYKILSIHPQVQQAHAGLINIGDEVVAINGESLKGKSCEQVRSLALGEEASNVLLQVDLASPLVSLLDLLHPQLLPGSALNDQDGKKHPSASSVSIELSRFSDYVPPCCKPLPDDPGVGKGEEEQKFLEKHRQRVAEELAGERARSLEGVQVPCRHASV